MSFIPWNKFTTKHKHPIGFGAGVIASFPKPIFDQNKKKLPTPYGLFKEWANQTLTGDWSSTKVKNGFIVCVTAKSDIIEIRKEFGYTNSPVKTPMCDKTYPMHYRNSGYAKLANKLGYKIKLA